MNGKPRNHALDRWIDQSGMSYQQIADKICRRAAGRGINTSPDAARISRWIAGEQPRGDMPAIIAEVLTELCNPRHPLTPAEIGMGTRPPRTVDHRLPWRADALIETVEHVTRDDLMSQPNQPPEADLITGHRLLDAVHPWLTHRGSPLPEPTFPSRVGLTDVAAIRAATSVFRSWDNTKGGGLSRAAVVAQLKHTVELLRHARMSEAVGRELLSAVGDLASIAGWMTHDAGRSAEGQRYLLLGFRAAAEAGDTALAAHLLNCLSRVSSHQNRIDDAREMVQLAQYGSRHLPPGRLTAVLTSLEARYHAITGDLKAFNIAAGTAADALAADDPEPCEWVAWFDPAEYHATIGIAHLIAARHHATHLPAAITMIRQAIRLRPPGRTRSTAFDHIGLARAMVADRQLDAAATAAATATWLAEELTSTRIADRLADLDHELAEYGSDPRATEIRDQIAAYHRARRPYEDTR